MTNQKLLKDLKEITWSDMVFNKVTKSFDTVEKPLDITATKDGRVLISGEDGSGLVDYYGEFHGGYPYIDPRIEEAGKKAKGYWEWESPGAIYFVD